jgi:hypothetical protein
VNTAEYLKEAFGKVCVLTVERCEGVELDGILLLENSENLERYDKREIGYRRERIEHERISIDSSPEAGARLPDEYYVYTSERQHHRPGNDEFPILRSYVDCVLAGYLEVWGRSGTERFVESTQGWEAPILDDRAAPIYPRAVTLPRSDRQVIDEILQAKLPRLRFIPTSTG